MNLSIIIPFVDNYLMVRAAVASLAKNITLDDTEVIALANGSDQGELEIPGAQVVRLPENIGNYPVFHRAVSLVSPQTDIVAIFHSDMFIHEKGFDRRIAEAFSSFPQLGLIGFVGSNEIDESGGRGLGTVSNFQGKAVKKNRQVWTGSAAEIHGRRFAGLERAAVVDGCAMVFRRSVLEAIPSYPNFPPHHFYDRLLSCQVMERGYLVAVLGIACDHISGQTAMAASYRELANRWCLQHLGIEHLDNPDLEIYRQAEARWLHEYRDTKRFLPIRVPSDMPEPVIPDRRKLNLGCDTYHLPGFVNVDLHSDPRITPEVLADVAHLPFPDEEFDFIYAGHLLEHLFYDRVPDYLREWQRVLRPGGRLTIVVPDVGTGMRRYAAGTYELDHVLPQIFGQYYSWDFEPQRHRYAYDYPRLVESVSRVPWRSIAQLDFNNPPSAISANIGRQISAVDWQMGVVLIK